MDAVSDVVVVFGPPAVGKMAVGRELAALRPGWRLVHNHLTIEPLLQVFDYGSPPFRRLLEGFRRRILEEAVTNLPGLVLTFMWPLTEVADRDEVQRYVDLAESGGGRVRFVELVASLAVRQERNNTELRLAHKASKRDRAFNDANLLELEAYQMSTDPARPTPADELLARYPHLRIDNSELSAAQAAARIDAWLSELDRDQ